VKTLSHLPQDFSCGRAHHPSGADDRGAIDGFAIEYGNQAFFFSLLHHNFRKNRMLERA
jgi:hypothetical protein